MSKSANVYEKKKIKLLAIAILVNAILVVLAYLSYRLLVSSGGQAYSCPPTFADPFQVAASKSIHL